MLEEKLHVMMLAMNIKKHSLKTLKFHKAYQMLVNIDYLLIRQIHEKPIGEYQVHRAFRYVQIRGCNISTHKLDILVVPINAFILHTSIQIKSENNPHKYM